MTNPYAFTKTGWRDHLHAELDEVLGAGTVATVRRDSANSGAILHDGTASDAQLQAVIDAHNPDPVIVLNEFARGGQTTDAAALVLWQSNVPANSLNTVAVDLHGYVFGGAVAYWNGRRSVARPPSGAPIITGGDSSLTKSFTGSGASSWTAALSIAANAIRLSVTGASATTVRWRALIHTQTRLES